MTWQEKAIYIEILKAQVTANKCLLIEKIIKDRTRYVTLVLEDTFQPFNASAIIRTAEIFGIQDIHAIQNKNIFRPTMAVSKGALKWIDLYRYHSTVECLQQLKEQKYTLVATQLHAQSIAVDQIPISNKVALIFGTEAKGITKEVLEYADITTYIPMYGFTQSFNVSVSVALCLHIVMQQIKTIPIPWQLTRQEQIEIQWRWFERILSAPVMKVLLETHQSMIRSLV